MKKEDYEKTYKLLQKLVQNGCVNPPGNETKSMKTIQDYLNEYGIESDIYESTKNRGNLLAKIEGEGPLAPALILGPAHVDVVPVPLPEKWSHDPFGGEKKDGFIYGRGTSDMLFQVAVQVHVFAKIFEEKTSLKGNLYLWIVADEELGGKFGTKWFLDNHKDKLELSHSRETYALAEGIGIVLFNKILVTRSGQKGILPKKVFFHGSPGHGAIPYKRDNALVLASQAILNLNNHNNNTKNLDLSYIKEVIDRLVEIKPEFSELKTVETFNSAISKLFTVSPLFARALHASSRNTFSPNIIHAGSNINIIPGKASLNVDIRALPNRSEPEIIEELKVAMGIDSTKIEILDGEEVSEFIPGFYTPRGEIFDAAYRNVIGEMFPDLSTTSMVWAGATDTRFCVSEGIRCYTASIVNPDIPLDQIGPAHGINEKIDLKTIDINLDLHYNLINRFLKK